MEPSYLHTLSSDLPLSDPSDDRLGFGSFAIDLAEHILTMDATNGFVIAVYGPWGTGKSTILNFVESRLKVAEQKTLIVRFTPWLFSGHEDLVRAFFEQLRSAITNSSLSSRFSHGVYDLVPAISEFADKLTAPTVLTALEHLHPHPQLHAAAHVSPILAGLKSTLKFGKNRAQKSKEAEKDITKLKATIVNILNHHKIKIVVFIDDIDRLSANEIRQVFKVIKAIANFPYMVYLLAFDREVVTLALSQQQEYDRDYLEKIVQVPLELPFANPYRLRQMFEGKRDLLLADTPLELRDTDELNAIYIFGLSHFITSPRRIARLFNLLYLTYPKVKGEVNAADFIAIQALRVFCPQAYNFVRLHIDALTNSSEPANQKLLRDAHDKLLKQIPDRDGDAIGSLLPILFVAVSGGQRPAYQRIYSHQKRLICDRNASWAYFQLSPPDGWSNEKIKNLLSLAYAPEQLSSQLRSIAEDTQNFDHFLSLLLDYLSLVPQEHLRNFANAIFLAGDELVRQTVQQIGFVAAGTNILLPRLLYHLLARMPQKDRISTLRAAIEMDNTLLICVLTLQAITQQDHALPSQQLLGGQNSSELYEAIGNKLATLACDNKLSNITGWLDLVEMWENWGGRDKPKEWLRDFLSTPDGLLMFLRQCGTEPLRTTIDIDGEHKQVEKQVFRRNICNKYVALEKVPYFVETAISIAANHSTNDGDRALIHAFVEAAQEQLQAGNAANPISDNVDK